MWRFREPTPAEVEAFLVEQARLDFSYEGVGRTRNGGDVPPAGYVLDHNRQRLGAGNATFEAAVSALRRWEMFPPALARMVPARPVVEVGQTVGVLVRALGAWWLNAARIVYVIDEAAASLSPRRFAFAYGTLPGHAERGEERFLVEQLADGSVWYDLIAFSRPRFWGARLARPMTRALQRRFGAMSKAAMLAAVNRPATR
jgi:uncharacterized protein (UPF0548 family)